MDIRLGDQVRFVNENMEGVVTRIIDQTTVGVTVEDDFEIPVLKQQLVTVQRDNSFLKTEAENPSATPLSPSKTLPEGLFLLFDPRPERMLDVILVNNAFEYTLFSFTLLKNKLYEGQTSGSLTKGTQQKLALYALDDLKHWPTLYFQLLPQPKVSAQLPELVTLSFKVNPKTFHQSFQHIPFTNRQGYLFPLDHLKASETPDLSVLKDIDFGAPKDRKQTRSTTSTTPVIDLHLEYLTDRPQDFAPQDILPYQLECFQDFVDQAVTSGLEHITVIHGIGDGILKREIVKAMREHPALTKVQNADRSKYGYGATMAFIQ